MTLRAQSVRKWVSYPYTDGIVRSSLCFDKQGRLWGVNATRSGIQTSGVSYFQDGQWHSFTKADGLLYDTVASITCDKSGRIWAAAKHGIDYYENGAWHAMAVEDSFTSIRDYLSVVCDSSNNIVVSSQSSVFITMIGGVPNYHIYSEIHRWDGAQWTNYDLSDQDPYKSGIAPRFMTVSPAGVVYGAGPAHGSPGSSLYYGGILRLEGSQWTMLDQGGEPQRKSNQPIGIQVGKDERGWVAYRYPITRFGLDRLLPGEVRPDTTNGLSNSVLMSMTLMPDGSVLLFGSASDPGGATIWRGLCRYDGVTISPSILDTSDNVLKYGVVSAVSKPDGELWITSAAGTATTQVALSVEKPTAPMTEIQIWPNPTSHELHIHTSNRTLRRIQLYNQAGALVATFDALPATQESFVIPTTNLPSGTYALVTDYADNARESRFVTVVRLESEVRHP
jgi:hypothetical protein